MSLESKVRVGLIGCGFFSANHIHAWKHIAGARLAAICDNNSANLKKAMSIVGDDVKCFADAGEMVRSGMVEFVDIVTQPSSHCDLIFLAAENGLPAIVQKPLAPEYSDAVAAVECMALAGLPLMVHENFRFQAPVIQILERIRSGAIGRPTYARVSFRTGWDIYAGQPYLAEANRLVLYDVGVHVVDVARALLGEVSRVSCEVSSIRNGIAGEVSAALLLRHENDAISVVECSYASPIPDDPFPQILITVEGTQGAIVLTRDFKLSMRSNGKDSHWDAKPKSADWMSHPWEIVQDSVVNVQEHWLECLLEKRETNTSGRDNLNTLRVVEAAYQSANCGRVISVSSDPAPDH